MRSLAASPHDFSSGFRNAQLTTRSEDIQLAFSKKGKCTLRAGKARPDSGADPGAAPTGTRPRDLRSSFITLQVYPGIPLTTLLGSAVQAWR